MSHAATIREELEHALSHQGLRATRQREQVYAMIRDNHNHPTADEIYALAREQLPTLSLATVYNCLETLVSCGLVREVNIGRPPVRYEPYHEEHAHFFCTDCGKVFDITLTEDVLSKIKDILPQGYRAESIHLRFQGTVARDLHCGCQDKHNRRQSA